ncbi:MAG: nuclease [Gemmatimonadetes bacterium SCN 70-22]|nr:MAG: nuclease [Gemmatimonadetes bacterium SCN 70-22]
MPIKTELWKVAASPSPLVESKLPSERLLEDMIVAQPSLLSEEWMLIGRQEDTGYGGRIDLLAIAPDGVLVLIELKRDRTPREVVAQALDYATWVERLQPEDIAAIYGRFAPGRRLTDDFQARFGQALDEASLNDSHLIVVVASALDASTERIVNYLSDREVPLNVLCFQVFAAGSEQFLSRTWLIEPAKTQVNASTSPEDSKEPWNGEYYCSFGRGAERSWEDAVDFSFICAGGGSWYSNTLKLLSPGDRVWVKVPATGFVGVARVTGYSTPASAFTRVVDGKDRPVFEVATRGNYHRQFMDDPEKCEYFVPVRWLQTVPLDGAIQEIGMFGNQNSVCKPTTPKWRKTVERLKEVFPGHATS